MTPPAGAYHRWAPEWRGDAVAVLAGGPSLPVDRVPDICDRPWRIVTINDSYRLVPSGLIDLAYFCDAAWWRWHRDDPKLLDLAESGKLATLENLDLRSEAPGLRCVRNDSLRPGAESVRDGACTSPDGVRTGSNSGYQVLQLLAHLGAARVYLFGYDLAHDGQRTHWHAGHPVGQSPSIFRAWADHYATLAPLLAAAGMSVICCNPRSSLTVFPRISTDDALAAADGVLDHLPPIRGSAP